MANTAARDYTPGGGLHPETAALTALLTSAGVLDAYGGEPLTEAMVLGIGGGPGFGYIQQASTTPHRHALVIGMHNRWPTADALHATLAARLNITFAVAETPSARGAEAALDAAFGLRRPAMVWVDRASLPWYFLDPACVGLFRHAVVAYVRDARYILVDDRSAFPCKLEKSQLTDARSHAVSDRNRLLTVESFAPYDASAAITAGIRDCAAHLAQGGSSSPLSAIRHWAQRMTDAGTPAGWPVLFKEGNGLFSMLVSLLEAVADFGAGGGSLRRLYAEFLDESGRRLACPALHAAAQRYRWLGIRWAGLGEIALPNSVAPLAAAKEMLARRHALTSALGDEAMAEVAEMRAEFARMRTECDANFPLDAGERLALFGMIQAELETIYQEEVEASQLLLEAAQAL